MIYGIGTDIVQIPRIAAAVSRHGERFAARILGPQELQEYQQRHSKSAARAIAYVATRFAAKEAFSKALGLGLREPMSWQALQTLNTADGKPIAVASGNLQAFMERERLSAQISISDESEYAVAFVIIERSSRLAP